MADPDSFPVGQAPWEQDGSADPHPDSFPVGKAPWEQDAKASAKAAGASTSWLDTQVPGGTPRGYIQGALNTLPMAGMVTGGLLGSPADIVTGPVGTAVGAGLGAAAGTAVKKAGERFILGNQEPNSKVLSDTALAVPDGMANEMGGQSLGEGLELAANTAPAKYVVGKAGDFAKWLATNASNVPKSDIDAYLKDPDKVMSIYREAGGDDHEMVEAAKKNINEKIQSTKADLSGQISKSLGDRSGQTIDSNPIISALNDSKSKINAKLRPTEIDEVNDLIKQVQSVTDKDGNIPLQDAHDLKELLSEQAKGSYSKGGQVFALGDKTSRAAKAGAGVTRSMINEAAPEVAAANAKLSDLHNIQDVMGRNLLAEGKPEGSFLSAASGESGANANALKKLGEVTGSDIPGEAKYVSAARTFGKPELTPLDKTGKSVARMGAVGLLGGGAGYLAGDEKGAVVGAMLAEGLASPAMIKVALDSGMGLKALGKLGYEAAPSIAGKAAEAIAPTSLFEGMAKAANNPKSGPDKWAKDGADKLIQHADSPDDKAAILKLKGAANDPKTKQLLIQASDLKPGSKAMEQIMAKLKTKIASDE